MVPALPTRARVYQSSDRVLPWGEIPKWSYAAVKMQRKVQHPLPQVSSVSAARERWAAIPRAALRSARGEQVPRL